MPECPACSNEFEEADAVEWKGTPLCESCGTEIKEAHHQMPTRREKQEQYREHQRELEARRRNFERMVL